MPEAFQMQAGYASFRPAGPVSFEDVISICAQAVAFASANEIHRLLIDGSKLTGFSSPGVLARHDLATNMAKEAKSPVKVAMVAKPEWIDPARFGVTVARNYGLWVNVFSTEAEALQWLLDPNSP